MSIRIRSAVPEDAAALASISQAAVESLSGDHYSAEERAVWSTLTSEESMRTGLRAHDTTTVVAERKEGPVGFATLAGQRVQAVYVRPDVQGRGVGTELLGAVEAEAEAEGVRTLTVSASLNAVGFYEA